MLHGSETRYRVFTNDIKSHMTHDEAEKLVCDDYYVATGKKLNIESPVTFDEKIHWIMLNEHDGRKTRLADKYLVRSYVADLIGQEHLIPLIGVWNSFSEIDFDTFPDKFVLKCNHGSSMNLIVKDKSSFDIAAAKKKFDEWMKIDFAYNYFEMQYHDIPHKIIAEEYIEEINGNLYDYKFHCANGSIFCCQVIGNRDYQAHQARQAFYDRNSNRMKITEGFYPLYEEELPRPVLFDEMVDTAEKLSAGFNYVRIDLYSVGNQIYVGEYTFTPACGVHPGFYPADTNRKWGDEISLQIQNQV
jgi:hypothetical protein